MEYAYTARFLRSLKRLPKDVQEDVIHAVSFFKEDKNASQLKFHKLTGKLKKYHSFSANFSYRVIVLVKKKVVYFVNVGTHDIYK